MNVSPLLIACSLIVAQADPDAITASPDEQAPSPILIDWIHANDFSMIGLRPGIYDYHATCGFRHGFEFLQSRKVDHEYISDGRLTPERLARHKLLFINLVSAEREPFLVSEIMAIRDYVKGGGSLLIVTDHTNCYFHSHRLKPLLAVLGLRSFVHTACDVAPHTLGGGNGWVAVTKFRPHPITKGLSRIALQTGGLVDPRYAVAWTSDQGWADEWVVAAYGDTPDIGYYGDFEREEHELPGPHGVVLAREYEKGRIVIISDQNMWSDAFINYADNYRLWLNAMAWLLDDPNVADWKAYEDWRRPRIAIYEPDDATSFGSSDASGHYHLMCLLARHYWTFVNSRLDERADLRVVADGLRDLTEEEVAKLSVYVRSGGKLIVVFHVPAETEEKKETPARLSAVLDLSGAERKSSEMATEYVFAGGGRIVFLADDFNPCNDRMAPPTRLPNAEEGRREAAILEIVRDLLAVPPAVPAKAGI
ncbi:MAG: hypothetical protein GXX96_06515 [Planctomycetaceae bacterium]|nr:hypothetical protein [Planctomycetaceae bacterium]